MPELAVELLCNQTFHGNNSMYIYMYGVVPGPRLYTYNNCRLAEDGRGSMLWGYIAVCQAEHCTQVERPHRLLCVCVLPTCIIYNTRKIWPLTHYCNYIVIVAIVCVQPISAILSQPTNPGDYVADFSFGMRYIPCGRLRWWHIILSLAIQFCVHCKNIWVILTLEMVIYLSCTLCEVFGYAAIITIMAQ